jgi:hypothetical protein
MLFLGAVGAAAAQDQVPDFTGTWSGEFEVVLMGRDPGSEGEVEKVTVTYSLARQDGRLIWGEVSSDRTKKRHLVLAFSLNNGTLVGSDTEALHRLTVISENWMESCFTDNGSGSILASCGLLHKAR